jgi:hypothetical protein
MMGLYFLAKGHVSFCHHLMSIVRSVIRHKLSRLLLLNKFLITAAILNRIDPILKADQQRPFPAKLGLISSDEKI